MRTLPKILALSILLFLLVLPASAIFVWADTAVDSNDVLGEYTSLAFNASTNTPAISYYDFANTALKYAWHDGSVWQNTTVDSDGRAGEYTSLAFNGSYPAISYQEISPNFNLKYAWYDGSVWQKTVVDNDGSVGYYTSLAFNKTSGYPAISYYDGSNTDLKYAWYDGSVWQKTVVDNDDGEVGTHTSLAFDGGTPAISYYNFNNTELKYAWYDGSVWQKTVVDNDGWVGEYTSLAFNAGTNTPAISYWDHGNTALKYAWYDGSVWKNTTVDTDGSVGKYTSLAFNASTNTPAISYQEELSLYNLNLKYAWYDGSAWVKNSIDITDDGVGYYTSLAFNAATNTPAISYWDWTNKDLKYAAYVPSGDISVSSDPVGGWIWLDSVNTNKQTDTTLTGIVPGIHNVSVFKDGYGSGINTSVAVASGETTDVSFDLTLLPPVADFTADPVTGRAPLTVQFTDTSSGVVDTWQWDFGDGVTSTEQHPSHTYNMGTYTVALTAGNTTAGDDTVIKTSYITVRRPVVVRDDTDVPVVIKKPTDITLLTSSEGKVLKTTTIPADDGIADITLPLGTVALDGDGDPLKNVTIQNVSASAVPPIPDGAPFSFAGFTYVCSPSGATFAPAITLTFTLSAEDWETLTPEGDFSVRYYNEATEVWENIPATVDPATHTVTATVSHFSVFALCLEAADETIPGTEPVPAGAEPVATVETTSWDDTETPEQTPTQQSPLGVAPFLALGVLLVLGKRR